MPKRPSRLRNPVARSPLLRKGGAHIQSKTGQRVKQRLSTYNIVKTWEEENELDKIEEENGEQSLPDFFQDKTHLSITK